MKVGTANIKEEAEWVLRRLVRVNGTMGRKSPSKPLTAKQGIILWTFKPIGGLEPRQSVESVRSEASVSKTNTSNCSNSLSVLH